MSRYTITPWRAQGDLLEVRSQLYSLDEGKKISRRKAVERVMAWKLRGNVPHAVESTALLVDAILHHDTTTNSIFSIRAVYSAAFSRFVTGFCDIGRHKERTLEPSSMLDIAKQIGMPVHFVGLRHEATHEELPGIQRLVSATTEALDWLWKVYWSRLEEPEDDETVQATLRSEAVLVFREFRRLRLEALRSKSQPAVDQSGDVNATCLACVNMCKGVRSRIEALAAVVVDERLILPSNRKLGSSLNGAYLLWDSLLLELSSSLRGFLSAVVAALLRSLTIRTAIDPESDADKEALATWLIHIISSPEFTSMKRTDRDALVMGALKWCCTHPGHWTQFVGRKILEEGDENDRDNWEDLLEASRIKWNNEASQDRSPKMGLDGLKGIQNGQISDDNRLHLESGWSRAITAKSTPIGVS